MKLDQMLFENKSGQRRLKPSVVIGACAGLFALFALTVLLVARQNKPKQVDSPFAQHPSLSRQKLDYNIIKLDTINLGNYLKSQEPALDEPAPMPAARVERTSPKTEPVAS